MNVKEEMAKVEKNIDRIADELDKLPELSDEDAKLIIDTMQSVEDRLANALAKHGVEIGDERVD